MRALFLSALLLLPTAPALAQNAAHPAAPGADRYEACVTRAASDPAGALAEAQGWRGAGGGAPARHCEAMALAGLGRALEAAAALEALGLETPLAAQRGEIFLQAADLRLAGGDASGAQTDYGHALSAAPGSGISAAAYEGRARARAALNDAAGAAADLAEAIRLAPQESELRSLHAAALRRTGDATGALASAEAAVRLSPSSSLALYERGAARRALGDAAGAQADWREALARDPSGAGADLARAALR